MNPKRLVKILLVGFFGEVLNKLVPIILIRYATQVMGLESLGYAQYGISIVEILVALIILGYPHKGVIQIANFIEQKKQSEIASYLGTHLCLRLIGFLGVLVGIVLYGTFYSPDSPYLQVIVVLGISMLASVFDFSYLYVATQQMMRQGLLQISVKIISLVGVILFVQDPSDYQLFALLTFGANSFVSFFSFGDGVRQYGIRIPNIEMLKKEFQGGIPYGTFLILLTLAFRFDVLIVERYFSPTVLGQYSGIAKIHMSLIPVFGFLINAFLSEILVISDRKIQLRNMRISLNLLLIPLSGLAALIWTVDEWLIRLLLGEDFVSMATPFSLLVSSLFFLTIQNLVSHHVFLRYKLVKTLNTVWFIQGTLGLFLCWLIPVDQIIWVAGAVFLARFVSTLLSIFWADRFLGEPVFLPNVLKFVPLVGLTIGAGLLTRDYGIVQNLGIGLLVYGVLLIVFFRDSAFRLLNWANERWKAL